MSTTTYKSQNKLVQLKLPVEVKDKLDEIFAKDGTTTPQALKMIATQIANRGFSPFTTVQYEQYSEPVSEEIKTKLREDELKVIGYLPDDADVFDDEESLKQAFEDNLK
ncbi:hypothetical protein LmYK1_06710 [Ligilactobacillus murinus]|jgi:antitoxin component of RelBE/YafQ-DinJ toxin-antitoxin module|uniref:hypothetical protein n=1 Tax=Ligilactobacillus murinus TaxID=1622 RepID=UPI00143378DF|nr:hypothetical protein [Ligilactobacillus murinus]BDI01431.1 hypothetical protein LmYK1_06710 [Ligilactobacillus murinus]GFI62702.1 hypothetical protein IMSAG117_00106 [Lactobacillaceae bacterium]